jgi:hypothetical protein
MNNKELRELDAWIAEHVMGWINLEFYTPPFNEMEQSFPDEPFWRGHKIVRDLWMAVPRYTTDPAAAMIVLEKCSKDRAVVVNGTKGKHQIVELKRGTSGLMSFDEEIIDAETLPLAICLFAKKLLSK